MEEIKETVVTSAKPVTEFGNGVTKAVISLSGGLDSTCLLLHLFANGIKEVKAFSFKYGQKHVVELKKLKKNLKFFEKKGLKIDHQIINLTDCFSGNNSSLVASTGIDIPEGNYNDENMASTVVPLRNVIFSSIVYSKAINWAVRSKENVVITLGIHSGDHFIYRDCRPESHEACAKAFALSDNNSDKVSYIAPFEHIDKAQVLAAGIEAMLTLGFSQSEIKGALGNTHTCYNPNEKGEACGLCGSCRERTSSFRTVRNVYPWLKEDSAKYQIEIDWDAVPEL